MFAAGFLGKAVRNGVLALTALALAIPAAAQMRTEGYKFLKAVEDKKGSEVNDMLAAPGATVVNSRDLSTNRTALHIVVDRRDQTWLEFLLKKGANPNLADNKGVTPLLLACRSGFISGVEALVKAGARVDDANSAGETPLMSAVHSRNVPLVRALLQAGADPDRTDSTGRSARDYAREDGPQNLILAEIDKHANAAGAKRAATYGPSL